MIKSDKENLNKNEPVPDRKPGGPSEEQKKFERAVADIYIKGAHRNKSGVFKTNRAIFFMLALAFLILAVNAGCTQPEIDSGRNTIGNPTVALVIEPKDARVITGSYKQFAANAVDLEGKYTKVKPVWSATYGRITADGEYVAPEAPGYSVITAKFGTVAASTQIYIDSSNEIKNFFIIPESGEIEVGRSIQLVCRAQNAGGDFMQVLPSWDSDIGNITNTGYFSAPGSPTTAKITARFGRLEAYSNITVISVRPRSISITPNQVTLAAGESQKFYPIVYDGYGNVMSPKNIVWSTTYGKISSDGVYTCPDTPAAAQVIARIENVHGFAYVNSSSGSTAVRIDISPANAVLRIGESRQFTVSAYDVNDNLVALPAAATWSAINGTVTSNGVFTAYPASAGLATLKAFSGTLSKEITLLITE
ncbi:MAG TPA: hypothetical protein PKW98_05890 [Candidatus Wallbacteria bacterium]|nr:MAG: hypothetical protein BWY32_00421 [bacterium ADurb.Bin243]HPG57328.1 hypothetical protein [Candidatus Wallbacteria bacterium]